MKIFLTGATGFIGSHVAKAFLEAGHDLVCFARNIHKIPALLEHPRVQMVAGELKDTLLFLDALQGCDACVHIALGWGDTPTEMLLADTLPSVALLEAAAQAGCKQFLYTSSTAAMGEMRNPMHTDLRCLPVDLYGATKSATECYMLGYRSTTMRCNILRPGYTFGNPCFKGATSQPDSRFRDIVRKALRHESIELIQHDGTQFISADDLAKVYLAILQSNADRKTYLGLAPKWFSWLEIAQLAIEMSNSQSSVNLIDQGWGAEPILFDVSSLQESFQIVVDSNKQLKKHIQWLISDLQSP